MIKTYLPLVKSFQSREKAEIMPAAIVTSIVSSILLLGIAITTSLVLQAKAEETNDIELTTVASNIDVSLRSDITQASFVTASATLNQPSGRLLTSTDLTLDGVILHIPSSTGECKVIKWSIEDMKATRNLILYDKTLDTNETVKCDTTSNINAHRTKDFSDKILLRSPFEFQNHSGRPLVFTLGGESLTKINDKLDQELTAKGVERLTDFEFDKLNNFIGDDSALTFTDTDVCVMNAEKVSSTADESGDTSLVCPVAETKSVEAAWSSEIISSIGVSFELMDASGTTYLHEVNQKTSLPLY
jgi:hypothetical protein